MSERAGDSAARFAVPALSVALAAVLLAALAVAALGPGTASASTVLLRGAGVVVELPDGSTAPLAEGQEVPRGAVVDPGRDGAVLRTLGRDTWLSADAAVQVLDGARQALRAGFVMVDARRGPALELTTEAATVTTPDGSVSRVERAALLRVGSYAGDAVRVRAADRRATADVAPARQVQVPDGGLPGRVTPLVLTPGDAYERALAADLVLADEALTDLAARLDAPGGAQAAVRSAALRDLPSQTAVLTPAVAEGPAPAAPASEAGLAYLLARAGDGDLADRFGEVRTLRADGGSWGVVATLVDTRVSAVAALLDALLAGPEEAVLAADEVDLADLLDLPGAPGGAPPAPAPSAAPGAGPGGSPSGPAPDDDGPAGPSGPGDDPSPVPPVLEPIDAVVDTVLDLLPTSDDDLTTTRVPPLPGDPAPAPSPTSDSGLLGDLLP